MTVEVFASVQDILRMLPTKDFEFNFLADFLMSLNQILTMASNLKGIKIMDTLTSSLCEALKAHLVILLVIHSSMDLKAHKMLLI